MSDEAVPFKLSRESRIRVDREGHISAEPHYVPRDEALILASNEQRVLGPHARVQVL